MEWRRPAFVILAHSAFALMFIHRLDLSIAIVPMMEKNTKNRKNVTNWANTLGEFEWDQAQQGIILSAFCYGYVLGQIPAGILSDRYGGMS